MRIEVPRTDGKKPILAGLDYEVSSRTSICQTMSSFTSEYR